MRLELCPLLLATLPKGATRNMAQCAKENCMWFYQLEGQPERKGLCSMFRIGSELNVLNTNLNKLSKTLHQPE